MTKDFILIYATLYQVIFLPLSIINVNAIYFLDININFASKN